MYQFYIYLEVMIFWIHEFVQSFQWFKMFYMVNKAIDKILMGRAEIWSE
jgi:hypothetical protein